MDELDGDESLNENAHGKETAKYFYQLLKQLDSTGQPKTKYDPDGRIRTILDIHPESVEISPDFERVNLLYSSDYPRVEDIAKCLGMREDICLDILLDGVFCGEDVNPLPLFLEFAVDLDLYKDVQNCLAGGISTSLSTILSSVGVSVDRLKVTLAGVFMNVSDASVDSITDEIVKAIQAAGMDEDELVEFLEEQKKQNVVLTQPDREETYAHILDVVETAKGITAQFDEMLEQMKEFQREIVDHKKLDEDRRLAFESEGEATSSSVSQLDTTTPEPFSDEEVVVMMDSENDGDPPVSMKYSEKSTSAGFPPVLDTKPPADMPSVKIGDSCYALFKTNSCWYPAKAMEIRNDYLSVWSPGSTGKSTATFLNVEFLEPSAEYTANDTYSGPRAGTTQWIEPINVAFSSVATWLLPVKARVIGFYEHENSEPPQGWYAGTVAEVPCVRTNHRYLIFFDDGFVQYCTVDKVRLIAKASSEGWPDIIDPDVRDFVRNYTLKFPEHPMVKNKKDTTVRVESNGHWWNTRVIDVDVSLVKVEFLLQSNPQALAAGVKPACHIEWLYRGSSRLEPLFDQFANERKCRKVGSKSAFGGAKCSTLEYVRLSNGSSDREDSDSRISVVSNSSVTGSSSKSSPSKPQTARKSIGSAAVQQQVQKLNRMPLVQDEKVQIYKSKIHNNRVRIIFHQHMNCTHDCLSVNGAREILTQLRGTRWVNPLMIPLMCGWQREVSKFGVKPKKTVFYKTPCGVRLRNLAEVWKFLMDVSSSLTIEMFSFDSCRPYMYAKSLNSLDSGLDYSNNKEVYVRIPWVNCISRNEKPPIIDYSAKRFASSQVRLNADGDFVSCCSCTDNCLDKTKCECQKLTQKYFSMLAPTHYRNKTVGYEFRRLIGGFQVNTGVFECNEGCHCDDRCLNKVAQFPIQVRLEIFKTREKGWGVRAVDDIPLGTFISTYSGKIHTEDEANHMGTRQGDEYHAGLDLLEVLDEYQRKRIEEMKDGGLINDLGTTTANVPSSQALSNNDSPSSSQGSVSSANTEDLLNESLDFGDYSDGSLTTNNCSSQESSGSDRCVAGVSGTHNSADRTSAKSDEIEEDHVTLRRQLFGEEDVYTIDGKSHGNIGRYFNHSCSPNLIVQSVFVDTHDLRFPWITFFTSQKIRAGTELCWDYHYTVDSVPGKKIYCRCGSAECRRRLL